jgi:hypothetical protein
MVSAAFACGDLIMRNPKVIICNFTKRVFPDLMTFFHRKGYEIFVLTDSAACPLDVHKEQEQNPCSIPVPCSDMTVVLQDIVQTTDFDLFAGRFPRGCKLTPSNTAIITRSLPDIAFNNSTDRDMAIFGYPLEFSAFEVWTRACEARMNLTLRLAVKRYSKRTAVNRHVLCLLSDINAAVTAQMVNVSNYGICLKMPIPIKSGMRVRIVSKKQSATEDGIVQWVKKNEDGSFLSGVTFWI